MGNMKQWLLAMALSLAGFNSVSAAVIDQEFEPIVGVSSGLWTIWDDAQTFTVGMDGSLVGFDLYLWAQEDIVSHDVNWSIQTTSSGLPDGTTLASGLFSSDMVPFGEGFSHIDLSSGVAVSSGDLLALVIDGQASHPDSSLRWQGALDSNATYDGGAAYFRRQGSSDWEVLVADRTSDLGFRTYMEASSVPEPTTITLLAIGLLGLLMQQQKKRIRC